ncbi:MAG: hypothetical protein ABUT20_50295 [Bacteroidota bacterium]
MKQHCLMFKTGNYFIDCFSGVCLFLPLLPAIILFIKKGYENEPMNFLMILCFTGFLKNILLIIPGIGDGSAITIENIFMLLELIFILLIFRVLFTRNSNYVLTIFSVIFFSSLITYYIINGISQQRVFFNLTQNGIIILVSAYALISILQSENLMVLQTSLFWASAGTIFYFSIALLVGILDPPVKGKSFSQQTDSLLILNIAHIARFLLYFVASVFCRKNAKKEKEIPEV